LWFQHAIAVLDNLWQTIVKERDNPLGCEHRAPKRRSPPTNASAALMQAWLSPAPPERKCLIDLSALE
jgi:hypothetical protein